MCPPSVAAQSQRVGWRLGVNSRLRCHTTGSQCARVWNVALPDYTGHAGPGLRTPLLPRAPRPAPPRRRPTARPCEAQQRCPGRAGPCPGAVGPTRGRAAAAHRTAGATALEEPLRGAETPRHRRCGPRGSGRAWERGGAHQAAEDPRTLPVPHSPAMAAPAPPGPRAAAFGRRPSAFLPGRDGAGRPALGAASRARGRRGKCGEGKRSAGPGAARAVPGQVPPESPRTHTGVPIALISAVKRFFKCLCSPARPV